jgi:hypothetical protein
LFLLFPKTIIFLVTFINIKTSYYTIVFPFYLIFLLN